MEITDIFDANGRSTLHVLSGSGVGYYIPSYQREYSWGKENIERLFEDTVHGINLLLKSGDSITFIGTVIAIHDTKYQTVEPIVRDHIPSRVMLIIDGQQRLVTLLLLFTALHEFIRVNKEKFKNDQEDEYRWIYAKSREVESLLKSTYQFDMAWGEEADGKNYQLYPRIIRSLEDSWSRDPKTVKYKSAVSNYLFEYLNYSSGDEYKIFKYQIPDGTESEVAKHKVVSDNLKTIKRIIDIICSGKISDFEHPTLDEVVNSDIFQETIFKDTLSDKVKSALLDCSCEKKVLNFQKLFRAIVIAKFMLDRMALTLVTAKNEDYAFDMFEALNTTGEPLTAFETFKPKVIQAEGLADYEDSDSRKSLASVEEYLEVHKNAQDKQKATSSLLVPFALAESGEKLSKRLSEQRKHLRDAFERCEDIDQKRGFVRHLAHAALFMSRGWPDRALELPNLGGLDDLELMCLDVLRASKHSIVIAILVRFYSEYKKATTDQRANALKELKDAVRAITSFSVLWRASRRGTDQIDSHYRSLMANGDDSLEIPPFARMPKKGGVGGLSAESLKKALREILFHDEKGRILDRNDWIKKASKQPLYKINTHICRFMLLAASHDTAPDEKFPGLVKFWKPGCLNMLNMTQWRRDDVLTIEHVAPQNDTGKHWENQIYDDTDTVDCLGNLTLLPQVENTIAGNRSWEHKRLIYRVLSAASEDEYDKYIVDAKKEEITFASKTEEILKESKFLSHLNSIGKIEGSWSLELVNQRSERMAELVWDRISPWLGIE